MVVEPLAVLGQVVARLTFLPTLTYNLVMERLSSREWWSRIDSSVILGAIPFRSSYTKELVQRENIKAVIALNESYELSLCSLGATGWAALDVRFLHLPTTDLFSAPSQSRLEEGVQVMVSMEEGDTVYVHCKAGRARSATLVGCYLMELHGYGPEQAVSAMRKARPHILLQGKHWEAMRTYHKAMLERKGSHD